MKRCGKPRFRWSGRSSAKKNICAPEGAPEAELVRLSCTATEQIDVNAATGAPKEFSFKFTCSGKGFRSISLMSISMYGFTDAYATCLTASELPLLCELGGASNRIVCFIFRDCCSLFDGYFSNTNLCTILADTGFSFVGRTAMRDFHIEGLTPNLNASQVSREKMRLIGEGKIGTSKKERRLFLRNRLEAYTRLGDAQ